MISFTGCGTVPTAGCRPVVPSSGEEGLGVVAEQIRTQPIKQICRTLFFSTTPGPSFQKEGTTLGARHCSGRRPPPAPPKEGSNRVCPYSWMFVARSPLLTFGRVYSRSEKLMRASLFSRLIADFTFHFPLRAGAVSAQRGYFCGA